MPKVRMPDGSVIDIGTDAILDDTGQNPLIPNGHIFTEQDMNRARSEEKDKLYGRIESLTSEITGLRESTTQLTAAEQQRQQAAEAERARLEEEARRQEESNLDAKQLLERKDNEWNQRLQKMEETWSQRIEQTEQARKQAEAIAQREREFSDLREYTLGTVEANREKIAPQLLPWINGNTKDEVDAAIARAISTTDAIAAEMQQVVSQQNPNFVAQNPGAQPVPPVLPGTRAVSGPANIDPAGQQTQQLTAEQIAGMRMDQYAALRGRLGIGGQGNNRGLFG